MGLSVGFGMRRLTEFLTNLYAAAGDPLNDTYIAPAYAYPQF